MFHKPSSILTLMLAAALAAAAGGTLLAAEQGLVRSADYRLMWVDRFGVGHSVEDESLLGIYFPGEHVRELSWADFELIPRGGALTASTPPEFFDTSVTIRKSREVEIAGPAIRKSTRVETMMGAGPAGTVLEKKVEIHEPPVTERVVEVSQEPTVVEKRTEITGTSEVIETERRTVPSEMPTQRKIEKIMPGATRIEETVELLSPPKVIEQRTTVVGADVIQTRRDLIEPTVVERRVEIVRPAEVTVRRTIVTEPAVTERTTVRSIQTGLGSAPVIEKKVEIVTPTETVVKEIDILDPPVIIQKETLEY